MNASSMSVSRIQARAVLVPFRRPPLTASGAMAAAPLVLIDLHSSDGVVGRAYVFAFAEWALKPLVACIDAAAQMIAGMPLAPVDLGALLRSRLRLMDTPGLVGIALAGIDMAAWDACARARQLPLVTLLGGAPRAIPAYNSCGLWIQSVDALADEASALLEEGSFEALKLRLGRASLQEDLMAVRKVRERIGAERTLMVDYNQSLRTQAAIERGGMLDGEGLAWIEEPIAHDNYEGYARIRAALDTPIQTGENLLSARDMQRAVALQSLDLVMPDVQRIGGVTGWLQAAALADVHDIPMSSHLFPEYSRHLLGVTPSAHWLEYVDWASPVLTSPVTIENGHAGIPATPGAGIEWDEDAVARYQL